ncbi:hypothetical protein Slin15195_G082600 [Septoria linicola]|uniref:Uncharacterized protein n=1 Tax=Septoria linicola TaxID=215465 RepID=A0A9Q9B231_9PEZI|nr:hypothetical protein Slin15195_G082600 [Septoria linicola]
MSYERKREMLSGEIHAVVNKRRKVSHYMLGLEKSGIDHGYAQALSKVLGETHDATLNLDGKRSTVQQRLWNGSVRKHINADDPDVLHSRVWCPFIAGYHPGERSKCAQIIPRKLPGSLVVATVGAAHELEDGEQIIWSAENGLLMHKQTEEALNKARFVIVPMPDDGTGVAPFDDSVTSKKCASSPLRLSLQHSRRLSWPKRRPL